MQIEEERKRAIKDEKTGLLEGMREKRWSDGCSSLPPMNVSGDVTHQRVMVHSSAIKVSNLLLCGHAAKTQLVSDSSSEVRCTTSLWLDDKAKVPASA